MFPGNVYQSRYTITHDGSLNIKKAVRKDEGHYVCSAISQAGASTATVFLEVRILSCCLSISMVYRSKLIKLL